MMKECSCKIYFDPPIPVGFYPICMDANSSDMRLIMDMHRFSHPTIEVIFTDPSNPLLTCNYPSRIVFMRRRIKSLQELSVHVVVDMSFGFKQFSSEDYVYFNNASVNGHLIDNDVENANFKFTLRLFSGKHRNIYTTWPKQDETNGNWYVEPCETRVEDVDTYFTVSEKLISQSRQK